MVQSHTDNTMCSIHIGAVSLCEGEELELCRPRSWRSGVSINTTEQRKKIGPVLALRSLSLVTKSLTSAFKDEKNVVKEKKIFCHISFLLFLFPASANRKTFKPSVKPGWYYFGRKMVREHS